ncbi:uncharacterized protein LOC126747010 [Anthonomus grandis grandis]|uniref:uncharacterized protein LOC126747010 n=1 Tax=Anthonomus grandis grandis TaxID=2921223 RepID=UPI0021653E24|nr:uncharacterized protein LOC126747010 [Anthonomus grandis grandis]
MECTTGRPPMDNPGLTTFNSISNVFSVGTLPSINLTTQGNNMESRFSMMNHTSTKNGAMENKYSRMKKLIAAIEKYMETRTEDQAIVINQHLQALSLALDSSIFDPHTNIANNFFLSLYELLVILEPRSLTSWYCVDVLINVCKNNAARQVLITNYHFLPCIARMIGDQLTIEKKTRLLKLMQDITWGIKIHWQLPHLPHLMSVLCKWIEKNQEPEVVTLSLGVLVNLCYKNLSSQSVLQRNVDLKKFIKMCLVLKGPLVEIYVCQITIILENISGYFPDRLHPELIKQSFMVCAEAYKRGDCNMLKQVVDFFKEYVGNQRYLCSFDGYREHIGKLIDVIESSKDPTKKPESLAIVLDFINFLIHNKVPTISSLYPRIIPLALKMIQENTLCFQVLALFRSIAVNVDKKENGVLEPLIGGLKGFLAIFHSCKDERIMTNTEHIKTLGALMQLLTAMVQVKNIRDKVKEELQEELFTNIFSSLLGDESPRNGETACSTDTINLYVYTLALVSKLVECNNSWIGFLNNLLGYRQVHVVLAQAICSSPSDVKKIAIELSTSCADGVSLALTNSQHLISSGNPSCSNSPGAHSDHSFSFMPVAQHERLQTVLESVQNAVSRNELNNVATSEMIEFYNYKISYLAQAERAALSSVEAATRHCTHLQHRITRLNQEYTRLQQSEFDTIQKYEEMIKKKESICIELRELQNKFEAEKGRYKVLHSQFSQKEKAFSACEAKLHETEEKLSKLQQLFNKMEESARRLEKNVQKKDEALVNANENIKSYKKQVEDLEKCLTEKQRVLDETRSQLQLKSSILDSITKMANSSQNGLI